MIGAGLRAGGVLPRHDDTVATDVAVALVITIVLRDDEWRAGLQLGEAPRAAVHRHRYDCGGLRTVLGERVGDWRDRRAELRLDVVRQVDTTVAVVTIVFAFVRVAVVRVGDAVAVAVFLSEPEPSSPPSPEGR